MTDTHEDVFREMLEQLRTARTAWHEDFGVPISEKYACFLEAIGNVENALAAIARAHSSAQGGSHGTGSSMDNASTDAGIRGGGSNLSVEVEPSAQGGSREEFDEWHTWYMNADMQARWKFWQNRPIPSTRGGWISVETRLPEFDVDVLLWGTGWDAVYVGYWRHSLEWIGRHRPESDKPLPDTNPTHWQPYEH